MPAIDTDDLSAQFVGLYRDNVFCAKQKVIAWFRFTCTVYSILCLSGSSLSR